MTYCSYLLDLYLVYRSSGIIVYTWLRELAPRVGGPSRSAYIICLIRLWYAQWCFDCVSGPCAGKVQPATVDMLIPGVAQEEEEEGP